MYEDYFSKIYNYIFYRLLHREQTEELVSDIFLKVVVHLDSFQPGKASLTLDFYYCPQLTDGLLPQKQDHNQY